MSPLVIALDGHQVITQPTSDQFAAWAYEAHCQTCATCRRGDTWCDTGRRMLAATAPHHDNGIAGYPAL